MSANQTDKTPRRSEGSLFQIQAMKVPPLGIYEKLLNGTLETGKFYGP